MRNFALGLLVILSISVAIAAVEVPTKVAFITAIYGGYDGSCKKVVEQSIKTDLWCFSDNEDIINRGNWSVVTTPFHVIYPSNLDNGQFHNSLVNGINNSSFNVAKYYKQQWHLIPLLTRYEMVVWLDGSIEITNEYTAEILLTMLEEEEDQDIITWEQSQRRGVLLEEVKASLFERYAGQDLEGQYQAYIEDGYSDQIWKNLDHPDSSRDHFGVWFTAFVAWRNGEKAHGVLDHWYLQTLSHTTQDQVSLPYTLWKTKTVPSTLPKGQIRGNYDRSNLHIKRPHGRPQLMADIHGGLGNQLFMVAHAIAYGLAHNTSYCFVSRMALGPTHHRDYWNSLLTAVKHLVIDGAHMGVHPVTSESGEGQVIIRIAGLPDQKFPMFLEAPPPLQSSMAPASFREDHFYALGYFQSPEAFGSEWDRVSAILGLESRRREAKELMAGYALPFADSVALHFRFGDFRRFPKKHPLLPLSYYDQGLRYILQATGRDDLTVVCFFEEAEKVAAQDRIGLLRAAFPTLRFVAFADFSSSLQLQDWQEMLAMSLCAFQIIANSTFSWWAAFLNDRADKIVIWPSSLADHSINIVPRAPGLESTRTTDPRWVEINAETAFEDFHLSLQGAEAGSHTFLTLTLPNLHELTAAEVSTHVDLFCGDKAIEEDACARVKEAVFSRKSSFPAEHSARSRNACTPESGDTCHELERERAGAIVRAGVKTRPPAYVITTSIGQPRTLHTMQILSDLGFSVTPVSALEPLTSSELSKVWSNRNTIISSLQLHLHQSSSEWAYIFEDDIEVTVGIDADAGRGGVRSAADVHKFSLSSHPLFQYLGVCVPPYSQVQTAEDLKTGICGRCAHAMAISKRGIVDLLHFITSSTQRDFFGEEPQQQPYFDVIVESWCNARGGFPVLQGHLLSPQDSSHRGAFHQDRQRWQSTIGPM